MKIRIQTGKGVTGCVRYVMGPGRDPATGQFLPTPADGSTRVDWVGGSGFGWQVETAADIDQARREMEFVALNQRSKTKKCEQDCVHITLSWERGEKPSRADMEAAALSALAAQGMANARAIWVAHNDEDYAHLHIVASKINPATDYAYDLAGSWRKGSLWAEAYERAHGGVINTRRETANELRRAIAARDVEGVIDALTRQRPTFTLKQLERALQKEIYPGIGADPDTKRSAALERAQFGNAILSHPNIVQLSDVLDGPTTRYTTRAVLEAEQYVVRAAEGLAAADIHRVSEERRDEICSSQKFGTMSAEQVNAFLHATGEAGLALIDGQAGTGKSFTMAAVRQAYEGEGRRVIGLAPTNKVAQNLSDDGFTHARTVHSELFALNNGRTKWDPNTIVMVDEAAMLDTKLMAMVTTHAHDAGAKLILVGDDRQLSSIDRGGMFAVLKQRHGAAALSEVRRQYKADERRAAEMMAEGNFDAALGIYERKGAIHWSLTQRDARSALVEQWAQDSTAARDKTRFVFAYTNDDVNELNLALRAVRKERGELEWEDHALDTAHGRSLFSAGDRIQFTATDRLLGAVNGAAGTIEAIDGTHMAVRLDGRDAKTINFDAANFNQFRHGYAGTIYKGQGATLDQTYLYHSEHWRSAPAYVALTRHREQTKLFVARNTAKDLGELARQVARNDDTRAASMFHQREITAPVRPLSASEILAHFAGEDFGRNTERMNEERRQSPPGRTAASQTRKTPFNTMAEMLPRIDAAEYVARLDAGLANADADTLAKVAFLDARRKTHASPPPPRQSSWHRFTPRPKPPWPSLRERRQGYYAQNENRHEPMTLEAVERQPWKAVDLALPADADRSLLTTVALCADQCAKIAFAYGRTAPLIDPERTEFYQERHAAAAARRDDAREQLAVAPSSQTAEIMPLLPPELIALKAEAELLVDRAGQILARDPDADRRTITIEAIKENRWNVLWLALPPDAGRDLAELVLETSRGLYHELVQHRDASYTPEEHNLWDNYAARIENLRFRDAGARLTELDHQPDLPHDPTPTIRMYRGIGKNVWPSEPGDALFFSTDPSRAAAFGELHYVDVTKDELAKFERPHSARILEHEPAAENDWRTADPAIIARLKPLPFNRMDEPLSPAELAERVQRIIDDPTRADEEHDPRVLYALDQRREQEYTTQPAAADPRDIETSQEPEPASSASQDAAAIETAITAQEMTDDKQAQYSRWTGEAVGAAGREITGPSRDGGGRSLSRTR